jgi:RsiW-degrading membrane proteinase PrsW (M82 family)
VIGFIENNMKNMQRPVLINAAIVLLLLLIGCLFGSPKGVKVVIPGSAFSGTLILLLAATNFLIGMVRNRNRTGDGQYYFLLAGVLLLIGFSVCSVTLR